MGYSAPPPPNSYVPNTFAENSGAAAYNYNDQTNVNPSNSFAPSYPNTAANPYYDPYNNANPQYGQQPQQMQQPPQQLTPPQPMAASAAPTIFNPNQNSFANQFSVLQQPMVQDMALQYGQRLADQGKQLVESQFEKYVPVTRLKYYFAVDNNYVVKKLILLLFPFTQRVS